MFTKLNFAFTAYLLLHPKQYEAYYQQIEKEVLLLLPKEPKSIIREIVKLCRDQNFLYRCLNGDNSSSVSLKLSKDTIRVLKKCGYLNLNYIDSFSLDLILLIQEIIQIGVINAVKRINKIEMPSIPNLNFITPLIQVISSTN